MQYTYNITFIVSPAKESEFIEFLSEEFIPTVCRPESKAMNPEMKKVVESGGEKVDTEHGVSIAFSVSFPDEEQARKWYDYTLGDALMYVNEKFGEEALFFITMLRNLN